MNRKSVVALGASAAALIAATTLAVGPVQAHDSKSEEKNGDKTVTLTAKLRQLNGSGASGTAKAVVEGETIKHIEVHAKGLTPDAPHAQHIHYGEQAANECPTLELDSNKDGRLDTLEGLPAYGPVVVSLNTSGDTSPASFLDVLRFPVSKDGRYDYSRSNIPFAAVAGTGYPGADGAGTAKQIAEAVRDGEGVLVIHGLDYDKNGSYNFSNPEGGSELDPNLPAEATDPAVCGVLERR